MVRSYPLGLKRKCTQFYYISLSASVLSSSQKLYTVDLLDRYRKALETAVQISCRFNLPPLPGRTVIVLNSNMRTDPTPKIDFCLPPDPEQKKEEEEEDGEGKEPPSRRRKGKVDEKLTPSVRACFFIIAIITEYMSHLTLY